MLKVVNENFVCEGGAWNDDELLECISVVSEAPNVATFTFKSAKAGTRQWFCFKAGQFLTFELPTKSGVVHRTYTISSSPSRPQSISVTVKAQADSIGTRWMLDDLKVGVSVKAIGPAGVFTHMDHPAKKYLFISAGSGVTPMMSMTTYLCDEGEASDICFIQCAQKPSELIFRGALEHMASTAPDLKLHFVVDADDVGGVWSGYRGMFNPMMLKLMTQDYRDREVFCCGPEGFMKAVSNMLNALGHDMERFHQESFQAPTEVEIIDENGSNVDVESEIVFVASGVSTKCSATDTVLSIAKKSGLNIPSGCTFGVCGTCKTKKISGEIKMDHGGGISQADIDAGFILACCSKPLGRVEVDI